MGRFHSTDGTHQHIELKVGWMGWLDRIGNLFAVLIMIILGWQRCSLFCGLDYRGGAVKAIILVQTDTTLFFIKSTGMEISLRC